MIEFITDSQDLVGKKIKYCNFSNMVDMSEINVLATEDNFLMLFNIDSSLTMRCLSEPLGKRAIYRNNCLKKELLNEDVITDEYVKKIEQEFEEVNKRKADEKAKKEKEERYKLYLELSKEFGGDFNDEE
ncbi:hypothetical protein BFS06_11335 [Clostridium perfringens]|uniref:hypothetical protein n=1 Tax=Clostridium perfringens TaxID=1502 RepID=UPI00103B423D|nr:hypothetical protein [Clostridium perfringens]TBX14807.1 hypothetical protein BFS06_11335 [Clostridium perfringens]